VGYAAQRTAMGVISIRACLIACRHMRRGKYTHKKAMYCNVLWGQKCNENHAVFKGKCALESQTQLDSRHMLAGTQEQFALMLNKSLDCVSGSSLRCCLVGGGLGVSPGNTNICSGSYGFAPADPVWLLAQPPALLPLQQPFLLRLMPGLHPHLHDPT